MPNTYTLTQDDWDTLNGHLEEVLRNADIGLRQYVETRVNNPMYLFAAARIVDRAKRVLEGVQIA